MNKILQNKLKIYSALTSVVAVGSLDSQAQIIHRDVNYTGGYTSYDIDIDQNGVKDFNFDLKAHSFTNSSGDNIKVNGVNATGLKASNSIIGRNFYSYISLANSLGAGYTINNTLSSSYYSFLQSGFMAMTYQIFNSTGSYLYGGNFGSFSDDTQSNKYLGVRFDISGQTHYGWMRFQFNSLDGSLWLLKDLAYNTIPNQDIAAGEINGGNVGLANNEELHFNVFSSGNTLNILTESEMIGATIEVVDMTGKIVLSQIVNSTNEQIPYNLSKGIYVVRLFNNEKVITRKISL